MKRQNLTSMLVASAAILFTLPALAAEETADKPAENTLDSQAKAIETGTDAKTQSKTDTKSADAKPAKPAAEAKDYTILKVNGEPIKKSEVLKVWSGLFPEGTAPSFDRFDENVRENVLRGIVSEHLIHKQAQQSGLANSPDILEKIEKLKEKLVTQSFLEQKASQAVTDEKLRAAYDEMVKSTVGQKEVRARHILVDTKDKAEEIAKKIKDGESFEKLAKSASNDKATAVSGGDLGYFTEDQMVPEFAHAAFKLEKGEVSGPVKSDFGWHIIKVEDKRDVALPTFAESKEKLGDQLKQAALKDYITGMMDSADVKYYGPDGKEKELTKTPDATKAE